MTTFRLLDNLPALEALLRERPFGLITDIDGTITPTSPDPLHVAVPESIRLSLRALSERLGLVAVISGRGAAEVRQLVDGDRIVCIGHYGMERWQDGAAIIDPRVLPYLPAIRTVAQEIAPLGSLPGVIIQDKHLTLSIHYRLSPDRPETKQRIVELLRASPNAAGLYILEEKMVVGIMPPVRIHKGTAVMDLVRDYGLRAAIYLGDDSADALAFRALQEASKRGGFRGLGIAVTSSETPPEVYAAADYVLEGVDETRRMLEWICTKSQTESGL